MFYFNRVIILDTEQLSCGCALNIMGDVDFAIMFNVFELVSQAIISRKSCLGKETSLNRTFQQRYRHLGDDTFGDWFQVARGW